MGAKYFKHVLMFAYYYGILTNNVPSYMISMMCIMLMKFFGL